MTLEHLPVTSAPFSAELTFSTPAEATADFTIPEAMREAAPTDEASRRSYMIGAIAAANHRLHPTVMPTGTRNNLPSPKDDDGSLYYREVRIDEMPYLTEPIVDLICTHKPDLVVSADRGGRYLALGVYKAWNRLYPDTPFPTIDHKIHFGRISKSLERSAVEEVISDILHRSGVMAEMAMRQAEGDERPAKILLLDDWVNMGVTVELVQSILTAQLGSFDYSIGTMRGTHLPNYRHVVGDSRREGKGRWADDSWLIGVDYDDASGRGTKPSVVRNPSAIDLRVRLHNAVLTQLAPVRPRVEVPAEGAKVQEPHKSFLWWRR